MLHGGEIQHGRGHHAHIGHLQPACGEPAHQRRLQCWAAEPAVAPHGNLPQALPGGTRGDGAADLLGSLFGEGLTDDTSDIVGFEDGWGDGHLGFLVLGWKRLPERLAVVGFR